MESNILVREYKYDLRDSLAKWEHEYGEKNYRMITASYKTIGEYEYQQAGSKFNAEIDELVFSNSTQTLKDIITVVEIVFKKRGDDNK